MQLSLGFNLLAAATSEMAKTRSDACLLVWDRKG